MPCGAIITPYIPGWDNHGMPIESAIIKEQKLNRKQMSVPEFRTACHNYAQKVYRHPDGGLQAHRRAGRLGASLQDHGPRAFEAEEVGGVREMYKKGYIYKGLKPFTGAPNDETALAEARSSTRTTPVPPCT